MIATKKDGFNPIILIVQTQIELDVLLGSLALALDDNTNWKAKKADALHHQLFRNVTHDERSVTVAHCYNKIAKAAGVEP